MEVSDVNEQFLDEFLEALQSAINQMSADGTRISFVTSKGRELGKYMSSILDEDWKQELDRIAARNMRGIKLHPAYQQTDLDDPKYLRILERAGALGLIVVTHAGFDIGFPGCRCCTPEKARNALQEVGPVTLVLAHMGGWRCWDAVPELLADTTALLDTAFSLRPAEAEEGDPQWLSDEAFVNLVRTFGAERILFGTDSPWADPQAELRHIRALPLSEEERAAILGGNAKRLLQI